MKVTVTQLPDQLEPLVETFEALVDYVQAEKSELVLLPEMPFYPWLAARDNVDPALWQSAVEAHEEWMPRLASLGASIVLGSRPVIEGSMPHNDAFVWQTGGEVKFAHRKLHLGYFLCRWSFACRICYRYFRSKLGLVRQLHPGYDWCAWLPASTCAHRSAIGRDGFAGYADSHNF